MEPQAPTPKNTNAFFAQSALAFGVALAYVIAPDALSRARDRLTAARRRTALGSGSPA